MAKKLAKKKGPSFSVGTPKAHLTSNRGPVVPTYTPSPSPAQFALKTPPKPVVPPPTKAPTPSATNPWAMLSPDEINAQATAAGQSQIQPGLDAISANERQAASANAARNTQNQGFAAFQQGSLDKAFGDTQTALNNLLAVSGSSDTASQQALAAALRSGADARGQQATQLGVAAPADNTAALEAADQAYQGSNQAMLKGNAANAISQAGIERQQLAPTTYANAADDERRRYQAQQQEFAGQRTDAAGQLRQLIASGIDTITGREADKAKAKADLDNTRAQLKQSAKSEAFQEGLAAKELNVKVGQLGLDTKTEADNAANQRGQLNLATTSEIDQHAVDLANVGINAAQVKQQIAAMDADIAKTKDAGAKADLKVKASARAAGLTALAQYLTPSKGEAAPGVEPTAATQVGNDPLRMIDPNDPDQIKTLQIYRRKYDDALRLLMRTSGLGRSDALRILSTVDFASWRQRANKELAQLKRRGATKKAQKIKGVIKDHPLGQTPPKITK